VAPGASASTALTLKLSGKQRPAADVHLVVTGVIDGPDALATWIDITPASVSIPKGRGPATVDFTATVSPPADAGFVRYAYDIAAVADGTVVGQALLLVDVTGALLPLTLSVTADATSVPLGATTGYSITIGNPNPVQGIDLLRLRDNLPGGLTYVPGSSTRFGEPVSIAGLLTWQARKSGGEFRPPFAFLAGGGSVSLHFDVVAGQCGWRIDRVALRAGILEVAGHGSRLTLPVVRTGPAAPLRVIC
jgi:uncharacterized repeat protein (TIGR01451 family)